MTIINLNLAIETECILHKKRKPKIYNIIKQYPVEIQDIDRKEINLIALSFDNNEDYVKPYIEYNGKLYEPYILSNIINYENSNDCTKIDDNIRAYLDNIQKTTKHCFNENLKQKKGVDIGFFTLPPEAVSYNILDYQNNLEDALEDDIKTFISSNITLKEKRLKIYSDKIICIHGEFYQESYGPMIINTEEEKRKISYLNVNLLDNEQLYFSDYNALLVNIPYSLSNLHTKYPNNILSKDFIGKNIIDLIIVDQQVLYETTKKFFGQYLFELILNNNIYYTLNNTNHIKSILIQYNINDLFTPETLESNYKEIGVYEWFKVFIQNYDFGQELYDKWNDCKKNNYQLNNVIELIELFINSYTLINNYKFNEKKQNIFKGIDFFILKNIKKLFENQFSNINEIFYKNTSIPTILTENYNYCKSNNLTQ
jgi:hypothetical protein